MYQWRSRGGNKFGDFLLVDLLALEVAYLISYCLRHGFRGGFFFGRMNQLYVQMGIIVLFSYLAVQFFGESSREILRRGYLKEMTAVIRQNVGIFTILLLYMFATKQATLYSRAMISYFAILSCVFVYMARILWKNLNYRFIKERKGRVKMLVITEGGHAAETIRTMLKEQYNDIWPVGIVLFGQRRPQKNLRIEGVPVVAVEDSWKDYVKSHVVDEVLINLSHTKRELEKITEYLLSMGIVVHIDINSSSAELPNKVVEEIGGSVVVTTSVKSALSYQVIFKRLMDIAGGLVGLAITGILFLVFAPVIYMQSPGPIFFSQNRVGKNGRIFKIYKFRSMYPDAEERKKDLMKQNKMSGFMFKMDNDPRVIPIGSFMRKMSMDEFPQFFNVLKGDMSLVGTRPPTVDEYERYDFRHRIRLSIKPGLTGLWQVSGRSNITDFEEIVALDQKYISEWSLGEDIKILAKTVVVVLAGSGAA